MSRHDYITASEIGEYIYCKRGWWLMTQGMGEENDAMRKGTLAHVKLADYLMSFRKQTIIALVIILLGVLLGIVAISFLLFHL